MIYRSSINEYLTEVLFLWGKEVKKLLCIDEQNHIKITRGDSAMMGLSIEDENGEIYTPTDADLVLLTVKKGTAEKEILLQKRLVNGVFLLTPEDTKHLSYWRYVYDVQLVQENGFTSTVIPPSVFEVCEEVTD